jgi:hypothetical protein
MKLALGGAPLENIVFYIDDIVIHSKTFEDHLRHLKPYLAERIEEEEKMDQAT